MVLTADVKAASSQPMRLALGTVQFGLAYGIAGRGEAVPEPEVRAILEDAAFRGVRTLDTASAYGDIETRLGRLVEGLPFDIVSKIPAIPVELSPQQAATFAIESADRSLQRIGPALRGLMLHRGADLLGERGELVAEALQSWSRSNGIAFGASCYGPEELDQLIHEYGIALAQLPGNALDQRLAEFPASTPSPEIHMRSAFLQGLLLMPLTEACARVPLARAFLERWHASCRQHDCSALEMSLSVAKSFKAVSVVVVGVDTLQQWREIADAWARVPSRAAPELACTDPRVVDPRLWSTPA